MPGDWKTIRVPQDVYENAKQRKEEHGVTWGEYVNPHAWHSVFDEPTDEPIGTRLTIEPDDMRQIVKEEMADAMSEVEINVTVDGDSDVNEDDVRNIVASKIDELKRDLRT